MADEARGKRTGPRGFWSGTLSFGLVSVPVSLFSASRSSGTSLRIVDDGGTPLRRSYFCSDDGKALDGDDIVRGYEIERGRYVEIEDEELEAIAPKKSQEIDLERFVAVDDIEPMYFERAYFLAPGKGGTRPYRLLARVMEESGRAGIATFVMRGKEYLVAIIAERGLLRAEILRFHDEVRTPADVGLPDLPKPSQRLVRRLQKAMRELQSDELDRKLVEDGQRQRLEQVVDQRLKRGKGVHHPKAEAPPSESESAEVIDLMAVLKQSVEKRQPRGRSAKGSDRSRKGSDGSTKGRGGSGLPAAKSPKAAQRRDDLERRSKAELYQRAQRLDIPGRSGMTKEELIGAIRAAG